MREHLLPHSTKLHSVRPFVFNLPKTRKEWQVGQSDFSKCSLGGRVSSQWNWGESADVV